MYLRTCNSSEAITNIIEVQTRPDVPGKVSDPQLLVEGDSVVFKWGEPLSQNGMLVYYYALEWIKENGSYAAANISKPDNNGFQVIINRNVGRCEKHLSRSFTKSS